MSSISGIEKQAELERLPFFNKKTAEVLIGKKGRNLDKKIERLLKKSYLISLKKGLYTTEGFCLSTFDKKSYFEYLANVLRYPSYLSLEYVLSLNGLIPEGVFALTSISLKSSRIYENKLGTFIYRNVKKELFCGYRQVKKGEFLISEATIAKALFDFLYLKRNLSADLNYELTAGLRINWDVFSTQDLEEFAGYVKLTRSLKMRKILEMIKKIKNVN